MGHAVTAGDHGLHSVAITDAVEHQSRRLARSWSLVAIAVFVVLALTIGIPHGPDLEPWEIQVQLASLGLLTIGALTAWRWEGIGGSLMLVGSVALGVFAALEHQPLVAFIPAAVFLVPALGFLIAWQRTKTLGSILLLGAVLAVILGTGSVAANAMYQRGYGPTHPQSTLPALPDTPVEWMWSGAMTDTTGTVVARIAGTDVALLLTGPEGETRHEGEQTDDVWRFALSDLAPATIYQYRFSVDGTTVTERTGTFATFPSGPASFTVAIGGCARLGSNGVVFEAIRAADPDLYLIVGDFFYADYIDQLDQFTAAYDNTLTRPAQAALYDSVPIAYIWDDHDYGRNDASSTTPTRAIARTAYSRYVPHYPLTGTGTINQAFSYGRVRFIVPDTRSARDPDSTPDGPNKTMLGATQLAWLEDELLAAKDDYALTVIVSSVPWIAAPEAGADDWAGYSFERQKIADFIAANHIGNLLMVAGDAHMIAIDDGSHTNYAAAGNATFPLLHAAALDRPGSVKGGPYSEGAYPGGGHFGTVEVIDTGGAEMTVRIAGLDWTGATLASYTFTVAVPGVEP